MFDYDTLHRAYQALADPWVRFNFVSSLDGAATVDGLSGGLNDPWDLRVFETLRAQAHAVVVGAGTIRDEGYDAVFLPDHLLAWRRARGWQDHPRLVIISASGSLDPTHEVFAVGERKSAPLVVVGNQASNARVEALKPVAEVVRIPHEDAGVDIPGMIAYLVQEGYTQILSEGGPHLFGSFINAGMVDELCLTLSPFLVGGHGPRIVANGANHPRPMGLISMRQGGAMVFLRYGRVLGPEASGAKEL